MCSDSKRLNIFCRATPQDAVRTLTFDCEGYELKFIQQDYCADGSAHLFSRIYKFYSPVTKYFYVVRAEYHEEDVFGIKFYCKKDRGDVLKYSKIVNKGDVGNILLPV